MNRNVLQLWSPGSHTKKEIMSTQNDALKTICFNVKAFAVTKSQAISLMGGSFIVLSEYIIRISFLSFCFSLLRHKSNPGFWLCHRCSHKTVRVDPLAWWYGTGVPLVYLRTIGDRAIYQSWIKTAMATSCISRYTHQFLQCYESPQSCASFCWWRRTS